MESVFKSFCFKLIQITQLTIPGITQRNALQGRTGFHHASQGRHRRMERNLYVVNKCEDLTTKSFFQILASNLS